MATSPATLAPVLTARDAIAAHVRWKLALQLAIAMREPLSAGATYAILHSGECSIGKWLRSESTRGVRALAEYVALVERHEEFHHEMTHIAKLINGGYFEAAGHCLHANGTFQRASMAIGNAIMAMDRLLTVRIAV
jgi:methyl-accepting chemotaxis protein